MNYCIFDILYMRIEFLRLHIYRKFAFQMYNYVHRITRRIRITCLHLLQRHKLLIISVNIAFYKYFSLYYISSVFNKNQNKKEQKKLHL